MRAITIPPILTQPMVDDMLDKARQNLASHGQLYPALFVEKADGELYTIGLAELPDTPGKRQCYLRQLGRHLQATSPALRAVVLLIQGWYVKTQTTPDALSVSPCQHPCRQETIFLLGRNQTGTRVSYVLQPFDRDAENQPVWHPPPIAAYNKPAAEAGVEMSLLDFLFAGAEGA